MPELTPESQAEGDRQRAELSAESVVELELLAAQSEAAGRAGWDDPIMDEYDRYDEVMKTRNRDT